MAAGQPVWVAAAVPALVVMAADVADQMKILPAGEGRVFRQEAAALCGVGLHDGELLRSQRAGLIQNRLGDGPLPNVMEQGQLGVVVDVLRRHSRNGFIAGKHQEQTLRKVPKLCAVRCVIQSGSLLCQV